MCLGLPRAIITCLVHCIYVPSGATISNSFIFTISGNWQTRFQSLETAALGLANGYGMIDPDTFSRLLHNYNLVFDLGI